MPLLVPPSLPPGSLRAQAQPRLTGTGVHLRPWTLRDAPGVAAAYRDPDIRRWHCQSLDDEEAAALIGRWLEGWTSETAASWAVTDPERGELLGRAALREINLADGLAEVAYWVLPSARGAGVATAAVLSLCRWAFGEIGFQRLELLHSVLNGPSCRVAAATGFRHEGTLRASVRHADGWHDMHLHARLRTDQDSHAPGG